MYLKCLGIVEEEEEEAWVFRSPLPPVSSWWTRENTVAQMKWLVGDAA